MGTCGTRRSPGGRCWRSPPAPRSASGPLIAADSRARSTLDRPNADRRAGQTPAAHDSARCRAWRDRSRRDQPAGGRGKNRNARDGARAGAPARGFRPVSRRADPAARCPRAAARARRAGAPRTGPSCFCRSMPTRCPKRPSAACRFIRCPSGPPTARRRCWPRAKTRTISSSASNCRRQPPVIGAILLDLARRETNNRSLALARAIVTEAGREVRLLPKPHRSAGFTVLTAPDIPSALVEIGCLSNPDEEKLLPTPSHQRRLAQALAARDRRLFCRVSIRT